MAKVIRLSGEHGLSVTTLSTYFFLNTKIVANFFFLHASAFKKDSGAMMFTGPSGVGKSTIVNLAEEYPKIADDKLMVKKEKDGRYMVYTSPFPGEGVPLSKIYFLRQDSRDFVDGAVPFSEAVKKILDQILFFDLKRGHERLSAKEERIKSVKKEAIDFVCDLVREVPCADLHFTKSREFLRHI